MKKTKKKGFTLAELLIVVAVIAILVAVAIPTFSGQLEKSRQAADIATLRQAYAAAKLIEIDGYFEDNLFNDNGTITPTTIYVREGGGHKSGDADFVSGNIYYNPKTGEYTTNFNKLVNDKIAPYGRARSAVVVADTSSLDDIGVTYKPLTIAAFNSAVPAYSASPLSTRAVQLANNSEETEEKGGGTAKAAVAVTFTNGKLSGIGFVDVVDDSGDALEEDPKPAPAFAGQINIPVSVENAPAYSYTQEDETYTITGNELSKAAFKIGETNDDSKTYTLGDITAASGLPSWLKYDTDSKGVVVNTDENANKVTSEPSAGSFSVTITVNVKDKNAAPSDAGNDVSVTVSVSYTVSESQ